MNILLADDDVDDCQFFKESLAGSTESMQLTIVQDGEKLMQILIDEETQLPDVLFLDINMPRKSGFECLAEIRLSEKLNLLPVVMFSTSFEQQVVDKLFLNGAHHFIRKPSDFLQFKQIIMQTLSIVEKGEPITIENFVITLLKENYA